MQMSLILWVPPQSPLTLNKVLVKNTCQVHKKKVVFKGWKTFLRKPKQIMTKEILIK
jgi:hypothetical protein